MRDKLGRFKKGHNWKGGLPKCRDCGAQLGDRRTKRCKSCNIKFLHSSGIINYSGKNNPFYGKKHSKKVLEELSLRNKKRIGKNALHWKGGVSKKYKKCIDCGGKLGDYYSTRCGKCNGILMRGSNHPMWQGGVTPLNKLIRKSREYKEWRDSIYKRDNYTCQRCGKRKCVLVVHHKKEFYIILDEFINEYNQFSVIEDVETLSRLSITYKPFWDMDNGETLCEECHALTKKGCPQKEDI